MVLSLFFGEATLTLVAAGFHYARSLVHWIQLKTMKTRLNVDFVWKTRWITIRISPLLVVAAAMVYLSWDWSSRNVVHLIRMGLALLLLQALDLSAGTLVIVCQVAFLIVAMPLKVLHSVFSCFEQKEPRQSTSQRS